MKYSAVIVAAGSSTRFKAKVNKLLYPFSDGEVVIDKTIKVFNEDPDCQQIVVVCNQDVCQHFSTLVNNGKMVYCYGGKMRSESVYHGLMAVTSDWVLVHDGARCFLTSEDLKVLKEALESEEAAILVRNQTDTIKKVDESGYIVETIDRDSLKGAQTPQAFKTNDLFQGHLLAIQHGFMATDDASVMEKFSKVKIKCVNAVSPNIKITTIDDVK